SSGCAAGRAGAVVDTIPNPAAYGASRLGVRGDRRTHHNRVIHRSANPTTANVGGIVADARLADLRALLLDLDGVIYRGNEVLPGARQLFAHLGARGIAYMVLTNNSTLTPGQYQARLRRLGIRVPVRAILTSSQATARYLAQTVPAGTRMLPIGERGLRTALAGAGFVLTDQDPAYVVAGLDRHLTYARLAAACRA